MTHKPPTSHSNPAVARQARLAKAQHDALVGGSDSNGGDSGGGGGGGDSGGGGGGDDDDDDDDDDVVCSNEHEVFLFKAASG